MMIVPRRDYSLFDEFFKDPFFERENNKIMRTDIKEEENNYIIDIDLPGYSKENIKIDVTDGYLNVNAKIDSSTEDKGKENYVRRERFVGECSRSFYIGDNIESEDIKASFKNGILSLEVPKVDEKEKLPEKKYIEIGD